MRTHSFRYGQIGSTVLLPIQHDMIRTRQSQLDNASREEEDAGGGASKNSDDLIDEIDGLKAELEESQEDVRIVILQPWYSLTLC